MNIANILGLHLGVMTKWHGKDLHKLTPYSLERIVDNDWFKDCKLLLTPLDKITEEDKRELYYDVAVPLRNGDFPESIEIDSIGRKYLLVKNSFTGDETRIFLTTKDTFKLASKGYDIGICPKEYKEV